MSHGIGAAFLKGRDYQREIDEAAKSWDFDLVKHKSRVEDDAVILEINHASRSEMRGRAIHR
jgi:16S rRNA (guanine527-N7)-methyltransferase